MYGIGNELDPEDWGRVLNDNGLEPIQIYSRLFQKNFSLHEML